jgi:hypothetical protein
MAKAGSTSRKKMHEDPKRREGFVSEGADGGTTMRKMTIPAALIATLTIGLFSTAALAEDKKQPQKSQDYGYEFKDDSLLGNDLQGQTGIIKVRPMGTRDRLIRPRTQFIAEMFKSIEHI